MKLSRICQGCITYLFLAALLLASAHHQAHAAGPLVLDPVGNKTFAEGQNQVLTLSASYGESVETPVNFYVALNGRDTWSGRLAAPNAGQSDGPFATLERAREAVRALKGAGALPAGGVSVYVRGGVYLRATPFSLQGADSGSAGAPIRYRAYPGETVQVVGGKEVGNWSEVSQSGILNRLSSGAQANVRVADLGGQGIVAGSLVRRGRGVDPTPVVESEISFQGQVMRLARYPNANSQLDGSSFALFSGPTTASSFTYQGNRPDTWQEPAGNIWVQGYWCHDWADSFEQVSALNRSSRLVTLAQAHVYGMRPTEGSAPRGRYFFVNVLEELDEPGEYYIDRGSNRIYFWPPAAITGSGANRVFVSQLTTSILELDGVSEVSFENLTFESSRYRGVSLRGCSRVELRSCVIRNTGSDGVHIDSASRQSGLEGCEITGAGESGVWLDGGVRSSLTPGGNYVRNSRLHHLSRHVRVYRPAVYLRGVGNEVSHCEISDLPGHAIYLEGNDHVIEHSRIHHVCTETADTGAFYMGRNPTERGNVIRYNHFHDIVMANGATYPGRLYGIYLDDNACGLLAHGNLFDRLDAPVFVGGGRDNVFSNNVLAEINLSNWQRFWIVERNPSAGWYDALNEVPYQGGLWASRYPSLANILADEPTQPKGNRLVRNVKYGQGLFSYYEGSAGQHVTEQQNFTSGDPQFVNYAGGNLQLQSSSPVWNLGFTRIPTEEIGVAGTGGGGPLSYAVANLPAGASFDAASRTFSWTPGYSQAGTYAGVRFSVTDGTQSDEETIAITVDNVNRSPQLAAVSNQSVNAGQELEVTLSASDPDNDNLNFSALSSNPSLIANNTLVFAGTGGNRSLSMSAAANQAGTATITVQVSDGSLSANRAFNVTVNNTAPVNTPPTISSIANQTIVEDRATAPISFTVGDSQTTAGNLIVTASSSNPTLLPNANVVLGGTAGARTITLAPVPNQVGSATIGISVSDGTMSATRNFTLSVTPENDRPTVGSVSNQTTAENTPKAVAFTIGDLETSTSLLSLSASSSNPTLLPGANIGFNGSGANRTATLVPVANQAGTATVTLTVSDGSLSASQSFTFTVTAVPGAAPTLSAIAAQSTPENTPKVVSFTVSDADTTLSSLSLSASSSNPTLIPVANIVFGGSGASRTATLTPVANQSGTATVTLTVTDGSLQASQSVTLTVTAVPGAAPTLSAIAAQSTPENTPKLVNFTVADADTALSSLNLSASSSNPTLIPVANIVFGGSGASRTATLTPVAGRSGTAQISLSLSDGESSAIVSFVLSVSPLNTAPSLSAIVDQSTSQDTPRTVSFTIGDGQTAAGSLILSAASSNPALIPMANIIFGGSGANRTASLTPLPGQAGSANITLSVNDGTLTTSRSFTLTVVAANSAPTLSTIADQSTSRGAPVSVNFTVGDSETPAGQLTLSASSSNPGLLPVANIVFGGSGANRTATLTPIASASGTATITFIVNDGQSTRSSSFAFRIKANGPPLARTATYATTAGSPLTLSAAELLQNASDPDAGDLVLLTAVSPTSAQGGTVVLSKSSVVYTPPTGTITNDQFNYTLEDSAGATATGTVIVQITSDPDPEVTLNLSLPPGYSLISHPLMRGGNTLAEILPTVPEGTRLYRFDNAMKDYVVSSFEFGRWTLPDEPFMPLEGAFIFNPTATTVTFSISGEVPLLSARMVLSNPGLYAVSPIQPQAGPVSQVLNYQFRDGDIVYQYHNDRGTYSVHMFGPQGWDNEPVLKECEAIFLLMATTGN